ncbi:MAG TPA: DUF2092 domain-containing protein [Acetobacteraceae bacterium]|nr:DUF2092 domain-containing protein [Acetobacteraceae bacterium]
MSVIKWLCALAVLVPQQLAAQTATQPPATAQSAEPPAIEPKAVGVLQAACATLASAKAMSFTAVNTYEKAARNGQPLFYAVRNQVTMLRPDKLRVITPGDGVPDEFYYNGKTMMVYVPSTNMVAMADAPQTIDPMLETAWNAAAIYFPFDDVILSKPCDVFEKEGMNSAFYVGQSHVVGNTTTDMVAVASDNAQAELWIGAKDHLPRLVRVVYTHEPAHALYQTEYSSWRLMAAVADSVFTSEKAKHATRIPFHPPGTPMPLPGKPVSKP